MTHTPLLRSLPLALAAGLLLVSGASAENEIPDYPRIAVETSEGNFTLELFTAKAPLTVHNFLTYVESGFYEGTVFHRVVPGFVVQGGGYDTNYKKKETRGLIPNESGNGLSNRRGFVAMARTSDPHSANSQFYINLGDNTPLDPRPQRWGYTVFGKVLDDGMEVVDQIGYADTGAGPVPELTRDVPQKPIIIKSMRMLEPAANSQQPIDDDSR